MTKLEELERLIDERIEYFYDNNKYADGSAEDWLEWVMDGGEIEDSDYDAVVTYMKEVLPDEYWSFYDEEINK